MARVTYIVFVLLFASLLWKPLQASAKWQTLSGRAPIVIANGGTSGLYPDQTELAYTDALNYSLPGVVLSCDLQMARSLLHLRDGTGICRTNLDLSVSTTIAQLGPEWNNTYIVDGTPTFGFFAIDIPYENLSTYGARQSNQSRTPVYDGFQYILKPEYVQQLVNNTESTWWLNSEYTIFIESNSRLNATLYLQEAVQQLQPGYVSVNEIRLLEAIQSAANSSRSKVIYKFMDDPASQDPSTNQSYASLLRNLTYIKTLASGILVPKSYIWPIDPETNYLQPPTTLVDDAHRARLEIYAYDFANDEYPNSFNYTFDPVSEILYFIESYNFSVDGVVTDFPTTASEAISCYASNSRNASLDNKQAILKKQKVISHNGASGQYPPATVAAYTGAIDAHVDYIDCSVQISQDGMPFCRSSINLLEDTNVPVDIVSQAYAIPDLTGDKIGIFPFNFTWDEIKTWSAKMYSPYAINDIYRDRNYDGQFGILTLADFLALAKNHSVGALITIRDALYLRNNQNLAVVDAVAQTLSEAGLGAQDNVMLQADESAALARLRDLNVSYPLVFLAAWTMYENPITLDAADFVQIKRYASAINLHERLVEPFDGNFFLRGPPTGLIKQAHDQNLTVYFQYERNEFSSLAFDLRADPTLQLYSLATYGIDGFVTDYPNTVMKYLDNQCLGYGGATSTVNFTIPRVVPGVLSTVAETYTPAPPAPAPAPDLVVPEPTLAGVEAPAPSPPPSEPAAASHHPPVLLLLAFCVGFYLHFHAAV